MEERGRAEGEREWDDRAGKSRGEQGGAEGERIERDGVLNTGNQQTQQHIWLSSTYACRQCSPY